MSHFDRRSAILGNLDVGTLRGLEIGPLHNPLVRKSDGAIIYVDHAKNDFIKTANHNPLVNNDDIVDIDIVWGDRPLKDLVARPMDYAVASHVIEHVPDIVGWLMDLHGALKEEGLICLAIPDRRFTLDLRRPESTVGEIVEAYLLRTRRPPPRHVFDQMSLRAAFPKAQGWEDDLLHQSPPPLTPWERGTAEQKLEGDPCLQSPREGRLTLAHRLAEHVASSLDYVDTHCWVFTPESFLDVADRLSQIGLFPFAIDCLHPTEYGDFEFYARLRKSNDIEAIAASLQRARNILKNAPTEQAYREMLLEKVYTQTLPAPSYRQALGELAQYRKQLQDEQRRLLHELAEQRKQLADEQRGRASDFQYMQGLLEEVKASTSWRVTWPLRWLGRVVNWRMKG
jgi:hypothetical protein